MISYKILEKFSGRQLGSELNVLVYSQLFLWISYYITNPFFSFYFIQKNFDPKLIGFILGCRTLFCSVGMIIGGGIADQFNAKKVTIYGLLVLSISYLCLITNIHREYYICLFSIIGLFGGISFSGENKLIVVSCTKDNRLFVFGLMRTMMCISSVVYPALLSEFLGNNSMFFMLTSITYFLYAILLLAIIKNDKYNSHPTSAFFQYCWIHCNSGLRAQIVPKPTLETLEGQGTTESNRFPGQGKRWAQLLARVFGVDVLSCPKCESRMTMISFITESRVIKDILASLKMATAPPQVQPACRIEQQEEFYWA